MDTTFYGIVEMWLKEARMGEVNRVKSLIDAHVGDLSKLKEMARYIKSTQGALPSCKYIKDQTGWGLKESKEYMDTL